MSKLFLVLLAMCSFIANSQSIKGKVLNSDNQPLEFVSVRLFSKSDSIVVTGAYTDIEGVYTLNNLVTGDYYLKYTIANHEAQEISVSLRNKSNINLPEVIMNLDSAIDIDEVTASGSLDVLKAGIDKKIYSVQDDLSVKGGSVNDVLNNIPSIEIDQDGNISLRGDANVTILIDGRPSALVSGDGQNMLDALPANSIERIEVVTNPSARYDPDGTSGIINIVLKKNKLKGFNGLVSVTAATGSQYEGNLALAYRNNRFNMYANYSFNYYEGYRNFYSQLERDIDYDSTTILNQSREGGDLKIAHTAVFGFDYQFNDRNSFGFSATGSIGKRERNGLMENKLFNEIDDLGRLWTRESFDPRNNQNFDVNLNYKHDLKEENGDFTLNANQSVSNLLVKGIYEELYYNTDGSVNGLSPLNQRLENDKNQRITTAQFDITRLFKRVKARTEFGGKVIVKEESQDTYSETRDTISGNYFEDTVSNFRYSYNEEIYSLYGVFGQELGRFKYQIGVRGEYAKQVPNLLSTGEKINNEYLNLFPSAHIKYDLSKSSQFSVSYSRRINRANSRQLNPFTSYADPFNLRSGNPLLQPEYIDSYDAGYSLTNKKLIFSFSIFHRRTKDVINRVKYYYDNNTSKVTYDNIDRSESTGAETIIIYKPFTWMNNTFSFSGNYMNYTNLDPNADWNNDGFTYGFKYVLGIDFWKKTASFQLNARYSGPRVSPQGIVQRRSGIDLAVEKRFFNKRLSVGVRATDIFDRVGFELALEQLSVRQESEFKWLTRRFFITASYQFGNLDKKMKPKRSSQTGGMD
ncbi:MAG: TonB-dependent receptor [Crocinitomicaceae bacterium]|nr:TonB-dependent receptor [Crocinitomicaceae bacterium]